MKPQTLFAITLLVLSTLSIAVAPNARSQQYTTYTITTEITTTGQNEYTVGEATVTTTQMQGAVNVYSGTFSMSPPSGSWGCYDKHIPFNATQGQYISGTFSSDRPVQFYVVSEQNYASWQYCDEPPPSIEGPGGSATAYSFDARIPKSGEWVLLFISGMATSVNINLTATLSSGSTVYTETSGLVSFHNYTSVNQATQTLSSISVQPSNPIEFVMDNALLVFLILLAAIAVGGLFLYLRTARKPKSVTTSKITEPTPEAKAMKATQTKNFCRECGSEIPLASKFCNNCGTKQS